MTADLRPTFAPLYAYGASLRRPAGPGLFNAEASYYDSRDDGSGTDPFIPNDQLRLLAGYEWEAQPSFTVGLQYYLEWTLDHDELIANSPFPRYEPDEFCVRDPEIVLTAVKHFLANEWDRATAQKRGGGQALLPLDLGDAEERCAGEASVTFCVGSG